MDSEFNNVTSAKPGILRSPARGFGLTIILVAVLCLGLTVTAVGFYLDRSGNQDAGAHSAMDHEAPLKANANTQHKGTDLQATNHLPGTLLDGNRLSNGENYRVILKPLRNQLTLHDMQGFAVRIVDRQSNREVQPAELTLSGGMRAHGHGLPTTPRTSTYDKRHGYLVEGVRFQMAGKWFLRVDFLVDNLLDHAEFEVTFPTHAPTTESATEPANGSNQTISWSTSELALLKSLSLNPSALALNSNGNRVFFEPAAAAFGHTLFFDKRLSGSGELSCAGCHQPAKHFSDQLAFAAGSGELKRNTPSLVGVAANRWFYWDGRRDSTWSQALVPLESPLEMAGSRVQVARYIASTHRTPYERLFGSLPSTKYLETLPLSANPLGDDDARAAWLALAPRDQQTVNTIFANIGKALAAYEAKLLPAGGDFDRFVTALASGHADHANALLTQQQQQGLKLFISARTQCLNCHNGPLLTNQGFHNIGTGLSASGQMDFGRMMGSQMVLMNEFNCRSEYSDSDDKSCPELTHLNRHEIPGMMRGAFKVPTLRGLSKTSPYMHDGRFEDLQSVLEYYVDPPKHVATSLHELPPIENLTESESAALLDFLGTLGDSIATDNKWLRSPDAY